MGHCPTRRWLRGTYEEFIMEYNTEFRTDHSVRNCSQRHACCPGYGGHGRLRPGGGVPLQGLEVETLLAPNGMKAILVWWFGLQGGDTGAGS